MRVQCWAPGREVVFVPKELPAGEEAQTWAFPKNLRSEYISGTKSGSVFEGQREKLNSEEQLEA